MTQSTLKASAASWKPSGNEGKIKAPRSTNAVPSAATPASAWGKKPSDAIRKAAPAPRQFQNNLNSHSNNQRTNPGNNSHNNSNNNGWRRGVKQNQQESDDKSNWTRGNRNEGGRGGRGRGGRNNRHRNDRSNNSHHNNNNNNNNVEGSDGGWQRGKSLPVELIKPGDGSTPAQKAIRRVTVEELLSLRMSFVAPPLFWTDHPELVPPPPALWTSETRVQEIDAIHKAPRMAGDVSNTNKPNRRSSQQKDKNDTAPPLEECAPLEINEETRWKAGVFNKDKKNTSDGENVESNEEILKKALLVLNKLSLTKFDKLSDAFIDTGIGRNEDCLKQAISLIVNKAQSEPHFSNMYASLCLKLGRTPMEALGEEGKKKGKKFKKLLLERCQEEFEEDTAHKIARATENITDPLEQEYHANIIKKNYLGHMRFIGELYKGDMIRIGIMLFCLFDLLGLNTDEFTNKESTEEEKAEIANAPVDEEKVECFAKLMTTIGFSLEQQAEAAGQSGKPIYMRQLGDCWMSVEQLTKKEKKGTKPKISNRIKFMLQDLIEMRNKGWKTRRKEETAKTIEQIHKEVAKEERALKKRGSSTNLRQMPRGSSSGDIRNLERSKSTTDADGFVTVSKGPSGMNRSMSSNSLRRSTSEGGWNSRGKNDASNKPAKIKKSTSGGAFSVLRESSSSGMRDKPSRSKSTGQITPLSSLQTEQNPPRASEEKPKEKKEYKDPQTCGKTSVNILKEYFVGGDTDDAVLSFFELIGAESEEGSLDRGIAVIEKSCGHVLESKAEDVDKYLTILTRCLNENKMSTKMVEEGIYLLLEFLSDIIIDAPLAGTHLSKIVGTLVKVGMLNLEFLLTSPEYFRTDGNAAQFAVKVMKVAGTLEEDPSLEIVEKLMTEEDKNAFPTAKSLVESG